MPLPTFLLLVFILESSSTAQSSSSSLLNPVALRLNFLQNVEVKRVYVIYRPCISTWYLHRRYVFCNGFCFSVSFFLYYTSAPTGSSHDQCNKGDSKSSHFPVLTSLLIVSDLSKSIVVQKLHIHFMQKFTVGTWNCWYLRRKGNKINWIIWKALMIQVEDMMVIIIKID